MLSVAPGSLPRRHAQKLEGDLALLFVKPLGIAAIRPEAANAPRKFFDLCPQAAGLFAAQGPPPFRGGGPAGSGGAVKRLISFFHLSIGNTRPFAKPR